MAACILRHCPSIWKLLPALVGLLLCVTAAQADCLDVAAAYHHVSPMLMRAIATVESGLDPAAHNLNADGSEDLGLMQINAAWLPVLAKFGIDRAALFDACTNAFLGSWILSRNIARLGATWNAVGAYNATTPDKRLRYARKVYAQLLTFTYGATFPVRVPPALHRQVALRQSGIASGRTAVSSIQHASLTPGDARDYAPADAVAMPAGVASVSP